MVNFSGYADVNGLQMYYDMQGDGAPLVQLHGGTCTNDQLEVEFFAETFQVIAPEQMGHGRTRDDISRPFHYHDMAEDTVALLRHLQIESALVLGFSDGGVVGLDMAINHPDVVSRLVVTGANFSKDACTAGGWEFIMTVNPDDWPQQEHDEYNRLSPDGPSHWPVVLDRLRRMWLLEPNITADQLGRIKTPTLVIAGDRDFIQIEHTAALFRAIPDAQLCVLPGTGHGAMPLETIRTFLLGSEVSEN
ncbi:MAG TPA: alpha/beta hydrolase [Nocardioidaceae bacterium]|nr:alpha/beta hydrolase [Nocardioidaceae bacterium]